jgi:signal peptidase I
VFGYWIAGFVVVVAIHLAIRVAILETVNVVADGMFPGLLASECVIADKLELRFRQPRRGEVITISGLQDSEHMFVGRVVAVAGDTLEIKRGHPWINGWEVPHCLVGRATLADGAGHISSGELYLEYLEDEAYLTFFDEQIQGRVERPYLVAQGEVATLADNRYYVNREPTGSWSMGSNGRGVPFDLVRAHALFRWDNLVPGVRFDLSRLGTSLAEPLLPRSAEVYQGDLNLCLAQRPPGEKRRPPVAR